MRIHGDPHVFDIKLSKELVLNYRNLLLNVSRCIIRVVGFQVKISLRSTRYSLRSGPYFVPEKRYTVKHTYEKTVRRKFKNQPEFRNIWLDDVTAAKKGFLFSRQTILDNPNISYFRGFSSIANLVRTMANRRQFASQGQHHHHGSHHYNLQRQINANSLLHSLTQLVWPLPER